MANVSEMGEFNNSSLCFCLKHKYSFLSFGLVTNDVINLAVAYLHDTFSEYTSLQSHRINWPLLLPIELWLIHVDKMQEN